MAIFLVFVLESEKCSKLDEVQRCWFATGQQMTLTEVFSLMLETVHES
jgi:hypothetical protein